MAMTTEEGSVRRQRTEQILHRGALLAALLCIPAVIFQTSGDSELHSFGNWLSSAIWLYFVIEVVIQVRFASNVRNWIGQHKLELFVVVVSTPFLTQVGEGGSIYGFAPLVVVPRFLKFLKFAKFTKIGKLLKSMKIVRTDTWPRWISSIVWGVIFVVIAGIVGTLADEDAHTLIDGLMYWNDQFLAGSQVDTPILLGTVGVIIVAVLVISRKRSRDA